MLISKALNRPPHPSGRKTEIKYFPKIVHSDVSWLTPLLLLPHQPFQIPFAYKPDIVQKYDNTTEHFGPNDLITREQAASIAGKGLETGSLHYNTLLRKAFVLEFVGFSNIC